jgi:hypothetical protein
MANQNLDKAARGINAALGAWLFISAFVWPHTSAQFWNTVIVGLIVAAVALGAFRMVQLRFVNAIAGVWLFFSIWALPTFSSATAWNNGIVAAGIFLLSMIGISRPAGRRERGPAEA